MDAMILESMIKDLKEQLRIKKRELGRTVDPAEKFHLETMISADEGMLRQYESQLRNQRKPVPPTF